MQLLSTITHIIFVVFFVCQVGRDYPLGLSYIRNRVKIEFYKNRDLTNEDELVRAIYYGRYMVKEMIGVIQLKKYRTLQKRYGNEIQTQYDPTIILQQQFQQKIKNHNSSNTTTNK